MPTSHRDPIAYAHAIAARLEGVATPKEMKASLVAFRAAIGAIDAGAKVVDAAKGARDAALGAVGEADDALDASVEALATALVGANVTKRARPFLGLSSYGPTDLEQLAYATEVKEVEKLLAAVKKKKPAADVAKAAAACDKNAKAVTTKLGALVKPQAAYDKALGARDALLPALVKATSKLKKYAALAWDDEPSTYASVFAPPDAVQAPKSPAAKKAAKKRRPPQPQPPPAPPAPPAPPPDPPVVDASTKALK
ncbi:MAG TPA: hypothetical protein VGM56_26605 [Byssovorax sp.]|jgi:hypothetical protein